MGPGIRHRSRAALGTAALDIVALGLAASGALLLGAPARAQVEPDGSRSPVFDTRTAPRFGDPRPALRRYLATRPARARGIQHFCVIGYGAGRDRAAQVHWREGRRLILWDGSDPAYPADLTGWRRSDLDLTRDVVATEAEIGGSSYLVTRAWVTRVLADCAAHGARYAVAAPAVRRGR